MKCCQRSAKMIANYITQAIFHFAAALDDSDNQISLSVKSIFFRCNFRNVSVLFFEVNSRPPFAFLWQSPQISAFYKCMKVQAYPINKTERKIVKAAGKVILRKDLRNDF